MLREAPRTRRVPSLDAAVVGLAFAWGLWAFVAVVRLFGNWVVSIVGVRASLLAVLAGGAVAGVIVARLEE